MKTLYKKLVKVLDNSGKKTEEEHAFYICDLCKHGIDTSLNGAYGHKDIPGLMLCEDCYKKIVKNGDFNTTYLNKLIK